MINLDNQANYMLNAAQTALTDQFNPMDSMTPDNKLSEGIDSVGRHMPAPFLPTVRYSSRFRTYVVISSQKAVAFANMKDGKQYIVPAGLAIAMEKGDKTLTYTATDVQQGIKNAAGELVKVGEAVIDSMIAEDVKVSNFCGINNYDVFRHPGGDGINPGQYNYVNFNPQYAISYNMDYAFEYATVKDNDEYAKAPLTGIAAFIGDKVYAGQFVTYDVNSNFVLASEDFTYGKTAPERIIGQVSKVTVINDPETGERLADFEELKNIVTMEVTGSDMLNTTPGYSNKGLPTKITYANGYGLVAFSIQTR